MLYKFFRFSLVLLGNSWWVIGFVLFCGMLYEKGLQNLDSQFQILNHNLTELTLQKESELKAQAQLYLQVASQGDLQWQELCLKRELGLICPGEKVIILGDSEPKT